MPNRWIRERCRSSQSLANLSDQAERLFWRLTTVADDFGRFEAEPEIVQSECFKRAANRPSLADINICLQMLADENIINFYNQTGNLYGLFVKWEDHQGKARADKSKHPKPISVRRCLHMQTDAPVFVSVSESEYRDNPQKDSLSPRQVGGADNQKVTDFSAFWSAYPRKRSKGQAEKAWKKLNPDLTLRDRILIALEGAKKSDDWRNRMREHPDGQTIPYPATWLNAKGWEDVHTVDVQPQQDKGTAATAAWLEGKQNAKGLVRHG